MFQLVNLGSSFNGAEFLCVVSRQCPSMQNGNCANELTDRGKVCMTLMALCQLKSSSL